MEAASIDRIHRSAMFMPQESGRRESVPDPGNVLGKEGSLVQGGYGTVLRRHRVLCYCYIARNGLTCCTLTD